MQFEAEQTIEFYASPARLGLWAAVAWPLMDEVEPGSFVQFCGWIGTIGFAFILVIFVRRAIVIDRPVLTLSPAGILDTRISHDLIPWTALEALRKRDIGSSATYTRHRVVSATFSRESRQDQSFTLSARLMNLLNDQLGRDGLAIPSIEFGVTADEFFALLTTYARAHGGKVD